MRRPARPLRPGGRRTSLGANKGSKPMTQLKKILLVDDDGDLREALAGTFYGS